MKCQHKASCYFLVTHTWHQFLQCWDTSLCHGGTDVWVTVVTKPRSDVYHLLPLCHIYTEVKVDFSNRVKPSDIKFVRWSKLVKMHACVVMEVCMGSEVRCCAAGRACIVKRKGWNHPLDFVVILKMVGRMPARTLDQLHGYTATPWKLKLHNL
jgi:hypothetical protein